MRRSTTAALSERGYICERSRIIAERRRRARPTDHTPARDGQGQAEPRGGRALYRQPRDEFAISSKVGRLLRRPLKPGPFEQGEWLGGLMFDARFDYSYDGVMRS